MRWFCFAGLRLGNPVKLIVHENVMRRRSRCRRNVVVMMAGQRPGVTKWHTRPATHSDHEQWSALYHGFNKEKRSEEVVNTVWSWILDPSHVTQALVAVESETGVLGGLAHHRQWPRPVLATSKLYLDDQLTRPDLRGQGIATLLVNALADLAKKQGLSVERWTTGQDNATAQRVYNSLASPKQVLTYDFKVDLQLGQ